MTGSPPTTASKLCCRWPPSQLALAFVLGILATLLGERGLERLRPARPSIALAHSANAFGQGTRYRLDLNHAELRELEALPGIGPGLARRIVTHRPFVDVDDLGRVPGIGPHGLARIRELVCVRSATRTARESPPGPSSAASRPIDLNRASSAELQSLPGIGPVLADRIVADRAARGPYRTIHDLTRVKGIKERTVEKLLPHASVGNDPPAARNPLDT